MVVRLEFTELYPSIEQISVGEVAGSQFFTHAGAHCFRLALYTSKVPRPKSPLRSLKRTEMHHISLEYFQFKTFKQQHRLY